MWVHSGTSAGIHGVGATGNACTGNAAMVNSRIGSAGWKKATCGEASELAFLGVRWGGGHSKCVHFQMLSYQTYSPTKTLMTVESVPTPDLATRPSVT